MAALWNRAGHYIFALWFLSLLFYLFFLAWSQRLEIGCLPYFHTWCGLSANLECMFEMCCTRLAENTGCKKSPFRHHRTTLPGCIFATMVNFGPTNGWDLLASLGHAGKFQRVSRLGIVTARHCSSGHQPNFAALNRGRHLYSAGRPSRWALAHILVWLSNTWLNAAVELWNLNCLLTYSLSICTYRWRKKTVPFSSVNQQEATMMFLLDFTKCWPIFFQGGVPNGDIKGFIPQNIIGYNWLHFSKNLLPPEWILGTPLAACFTFLLFRLLDLTPEDLMMSFLIKLMGQATISG